MKKFLLFLPLLPALYLASPKYLLAKSVECYTQYGPCPSDISDRLQSLEGIPLLHSLPAAQLKVQLADFPQVRSASLYRRLPQTLVVSIDLRRPIGQVLGTQANPVYALVDEEGAVFSQSPASINLPLLHLSGDISPSSQLSPAQTSAIAALNRVSQLTASMPTGVLTDSDLVISLPPSLQIVINVDRPPAAWYPSLQLILARSKISSKFPKKIDLRFNQPVLVY